MRALLLAAFLLSATPAWAQDTNSCDKFKWPLARERALLAQAPPAKSGSEMKLASAIKLTLVPAADAKLPFPPTRTPKDDSFAGFVNLASPSIAGTYRVTLTANAWIEVVQDGKIMKSGDFSGVTGCDGLRKSVKFDLAPRPFTVELSGMPTPEIGVAVTQD